VSITRGGFAPRRVVGEVCEINAPAKSGARWVFDLSENLLGDWPAVFLRSVAAIFSEGLEEVNEKLTCIGPVRVTFAPKFPVKLTLTSHGNANNSEI